MSVPSWLVRTFVALLGIAAVGGLAWWTPGESSNQALAADPPAAPKPSNPQPPRKTDDDPLGKPPLSVVTWKFKRVAPEADAREFNQDDAAKWVNQDLRKAGPDDVGATIAAFERLGGFTKIEMLAKGRTKPQGGAAAAPLLDKEVSLRMARHRRQMINRVLGEALTAAGLDKTYTVGALDSGNKKSGIASDVDQTVFLLPKDPKERGRLSAKMIDTFIKAFTEHFQAAYHQPPEFFGIVSLNGASFYPDWRAEQTVAEFRLESDRVFKEKRKNLDAYRTEGQLKSQAERRGYVELTKQAQRMAAYNDIRDRVTALAARTDLGDQARSSELGKLYQELLAHSAFEGFDRTGLKTLADVRDRLEFESPWTEVTVDPRTGKLLVSQLESPAGKVLPNEPEFAKRFSFDGSWDNKMMFENHPDSRPKFLLRSVNEGPGVHFLPSSEVPADGIFRYGPFDYEAYYAKGQLVELKNFVSSIYKHLDEPTRERYRRAMDMAARMRLRHKGEPGFAGLTDAQVLGEYVRDLSPAEKAFYAGDPAKGIKGVGDKALEQIRMERALRAWEADAREVMFENVLMTAEQPAHILNGKLDANEIARIKADTRAGAFNPEKLQSATIQQFYHFFIDGLNAEHARALAAGDFASAAHMPDMADRVLKKFQNDPQLQAKLLEIAQAAAQARLAWGPEGKPDLTLCEKVRDQLAKVRQQGEAWHALAAEEFGRWRRGEPGYTNRELASQMLEAMHDNYQLKNYELLHTLGFELHESLGDRGRTTIEVGKWNGKEALVHMLALGNVDSALQVWKAYLEGGSKEAAFQAALWQIAMQLPYTADAAMLAEAYRADNFKDRAKPLVMLASGWYIPGAGQAYAIASIATTAVWIAGYYVFEPLRDDLADLTYQGYLEKQSAGWFTAGTRMIQRSQRAGLLENVPIRVILVPVLDEDGQPIKNKDGSEQTSFVFAPYSLKEASDLDFVKVSRERSLEQDYQWLRDQGLLGGGKEWDAALARASNWTANPKLNFEARRASMFFPYVGRATALLEKENISIYQPSEKNPGINREAILALKAGIFDKVVLDWVKGEGVFANIVDPEVNLLLKDKIDQIKDRLALRLATDYVNSYLLVRYGNRSIERNIRSNVMVAREVEVRKEVNHGVAAQHKALQVVANPAQADAIHDVVDARRLHYRVPAPRIRVRPRVVRVSAQPGENDEAAECVVSVVCDPDVYPRAAGDAYRHETEWKTIHRGKDKVLTVKVTVRDAKGNVIGQPVEQDVGVLLDVDPAGPVQIAVRRSKFEAHNLIEVTSADLASLDQQPEGTILRLVLYRATVGQPLEEVPVLQIQTERNWRPKTPITEKDVDVTTSNLQFSRRIAPNKVILVDISPGDKPTMPRKPMIYQIHQRWVVDDQSGEESLSEVTKPGPAFVNIPGLKKDGEPKPGRMYSGFADLSASMALADQNYDYWGAHFTVTVDRWKGNFWAPRIEGERLAAANGQRVERSVAPALLRYPSRPDGVTVILTAEGGGFKATRTVHFPPDPQAIAEQKKQAQDVQKELDREVQNAKTEREKLQKQVKETEPAAQKAAAKIKDWNTCNDWAAAQRRYLQAQDPLRFLDEVSLPLTQNGLQDRLAVLKDDWKKVLELRKKRADLFQKQKDNALKELDEQEAINKKLLTYAPAAAKKDLQNSAKDLATSRKSQDGFYQISWANLQPQLAEAALRIGDVPAYESAMLEQIRIQEKKKEVSIGDLYSQMAENLVILTGNREKSVDLLQKARDRWLAEVPPEVAARARKQNEDLPVPPWWPEGKVPPAKKK